MLFQSNIIDFIFTVSMKDKMFEKAIDKKFLSHTFSLFFFPECDDGTYGLECENACGNCSDGNWCNHMNGSCPNGCDMGVFGDTCDKGS